MYLLTCGHSKQVFSLFSAMPLRRTFSKALYYINEYALLKTIYVSATISDIVVS